MEYDPEAYDWEAVLSKGTKITIKEGDRLTAGHVFQTSQAVDITGVSDIKITEGDPDLPSGFAGVPSAVEVEAFDKDGDRILEVKLDSIYVIESLSRGDSEVLEEE